MSNTVNKLVDKLDNLDGNIRENKWKIISKMHIVFATLGYPELGSAILDTNPHIQNFEDSIFWLLYVASIKLMSQTVGADIQY